MPRLVIATLCLICASMLQAQEPVVRRLQDVKAIYVPPMDGQDASLAEMVSAKLVSHLAKSGSISIVESEDKADAILMGSGLIQTTTNPYGRTGYHVQVAMRLTSKDGVVLWADDVSNSPFARSATSSFADNVAKKLVHAISADDRKK